MQVAKPIEVEVQQPSITVAHEPPTELQAIRIGFTDYEGLRKALNEVRERRNISLEVLWEISGAPDRYFSKIFGPNAVKRLGMDSLGRVFAALGVRAVLIDDPQALQLVQEPYSARDQAHTKSAKARWNASPGTPTRRGSRASK